MLILSWFEHHGASFGCETDICISSIKLYERGVNEVHLCDSIYGYTFITYINVQCAY